MPGKKKGRGKGGNKGGSRGGSPSKGGNAGASQGNGTPAQQLDDGYRSFQPVEPDDPEEIERLEQEHFQNIVHAFSFYREKSLERVNRFQRCINLLPADHRRRIPDIDGAIEKQRMAIDKNYAFIQKILQPHALFPSQPELSAAAAQSSRRRRPTEMDSEKVESTLRQFYRDWSNEGKAERDVCFQPIIDAVVEQFGETGMKLGHQPRVLVPGAGLGRLVWDFAHLGYDSQGNEFSYFMLLASNYILNMTSGTEGDVIYPYIHQHTNVYDRADQFRSIAVPDVVTSDLPPHAVFSMAAGDFLEVYANQKEEWDAVASLFFLDTARNIVHYIELIHQLLRPGGIFVNFGPLLYHFADMHDHNSVELSYDELRAIMVSYGFKFLKEERRSSTYAGNPRTMMRTVYDCVFFVAQKT